MNPPAAHRSYDIFKAVVALILLVIFIILLLRAQPPASPTSPQVSPAGVGTSSIAQPSPTTRPTEPSAPTQSVPTATRPAPTATIAASATAIPTATIAPTPSPTEQPVTAPTQQPTPAALPTNTPEPSPTSAPALVSVDCPLALPTRLSVGDRARVTNNLNLRASPVFGSTLILTSPTGTELEIIGGPTCQPYQGGAYLWWQVSRSDGQTGWSAEGSINGNFYFLEPLD